MNPLVLKAGNDLIPFRDVKRINIAHLERAQVAIETYVGETYYAFGFDAIEALMAIKPSAMEGRRLKWKQHVWAFHNLVGHPVVQLLAWVGLKKAAIRFHDWTTPTPSGFKETGD